MKLKLKGD